MYQLALWQLIVAALFLSAVMLYIGFRIAVTMTVTGLATDTDLRLQLQQDFYKRGLVVKIYPHTECDPTQGEEFGSWLQRQIAIRDLRKVAVSTVRAADDFQSR